MGKKVTLTSLVFKLLLLMQSLASCSTDNERSIYFQEKLSEATNGKDKIEVKLSDITNFQWNKVCFKKNDEIELVFYQANATIKISLKYDKYFIDDGYVKDSPDTHCYSNNDTIIAQKKYFSGHAVIQFLDISNVETTGNIK